MSEGDGLPLLLLLLLLLFFHPIQPFPSQNPSKPEGKSETMRLGRYNVFRPRLKERTEMVFLYLKPVDTRDLFLARLLTRNCTQQTKRSIREAKKWRRGILGIVQESQRPCTDDQPVKYTCEKSKEADLLCWVHAVPYTRKNENVRFCLCFKLPSSICSYATLQGSRRRTR